MEILDNLDTWRTAVGRHFRCRETNESRGGGAEEFWPFPWRGREGEKNGFIDHQRFGGGGGGGDGVAQELGIGRGVGWGGVGFI